ncbi:MAG TPA: hypothetical protein VHV31_07400 [Nitrolancea sp.]|jgi:hypothetical protein|nr:hypothetical protein [Nitrolancea sp.]
MIGDVQLLVTRREAFFGSVRPMRVHLDDHNVVDLRMGETITLALVPGMHRLWVSMDSQTSAAADFEAREGDDIAYECRMPVGFMAVAKGYIVHRGSIVLRPAGSGFAPASAVPSRREMLSRTALSVPVIIIVWIVSLVAVGVSGAPAWIVAGASTMTTVGAGTYVHVSSAPLRWWRRFRSSWRRC